MDKCCYRMSLHCKNNVPSITNIIQAVVYAYTKLLNIIISGSNEVDRLFNGYQTHTYTSTARERERETTSISHFQTMN